MTEAPLKNKRFLSLRIKITVVFILIFTPVFVASYYWFFTYTSEQVQLGITNDLIQTINGAVEGMDKDGFVKLYADERDNDPRCLPGSESKSGYYPDEKDNFLYWEHVRWLKTIENLEPEARLYTYVKGEKPGEVFGIGSSGALHDPQGGFKFCESYISENTQIYQGLTKRVDVWDESYSDPFGRWITTYMPIEDKGVIIGAIGVDILASYVDEVQDEILRSGLIAFVVSYGLISWLVYIMAGIVTKPIVKLASVSQDIGDGNYDQDLDTFRSKGKSEDEIDTLINTFKIMISKVAKREQTLRSRVQQLEIMIDEGKREKQVQDIVDSDFFKDIQEKAQNMRDRDKAPKKKKSEGNK
ncbi:MAG: HAMP domain-containing protein [Anaerolineae bacterium]|nr:HAMP domain-containing protein [Anaerolineae bacterium]MDK1082333.1 HAMP domain-containing protein [Anaerolineae bacterium]